MSLAFCRLSSRQLFSPRSLNYSQRGFTICSHSVLSSRPALPRNFPALKNINATRSSNHAFPLLFKAAGVAGVGLGLSAFAAPPVNCEAPNNTDPRQPASVVTPLPQPPTSNVNVYELSFGTVCGVCAGVFIKKGAKAVAFVLGGIFVLLQYLRSANVVTVQWGSVGSRYRKAFYTTDPVTGSEKPPTLYSVWSWLVDFLTTDFQPRATFLAGLALGLRIG